MAILRREEVIDSQSVLIGGSQGMAEEIFGNTGSFITETKAPQHQEKADPVIRGLF